MYIKKWSLAAQFQKGFVLCMTSVSNTFKQFFSPSKGLLPIHAWYVLAGLLPVWFLQSHLLVSPEVAQTIVTKRTLVQMLLCVSKLTHFTSSLLWKERLGVVGGNSVGAMCGLESRSNPVVPVALIWFFSLILFPSFWHCRKVLVCKC